MVTAAKLAGLMNTPDLITSAQAAAIAGITSSTFRTLLARGTNTKDPVPQPVMRVARVALWQRADIEQWAATRDRKRGRAST